MKGTDVQCKTGAKGLSFASYILILLAGLLIQVHGQGLSQTLRGKVLDPDRAAIRNAQLIVTDKRQAIILASVTSETGESSLNLVPGQYTLTISAEGFAETSLPLSISQNAIEPIEI